MSELIVAKAGGTSNRDSAAIEQSMNWAEQSDIFVVSAPGKLEGDGISSDKITNLLLYIRDGYVSRGEISSEITEIVTERYSSIVNGLGKLSLPKDWVDRIPSRIEEAAHHSEDSISMLGERLQAEIYQGAGYNLLDPGRCAHDLGGVPEAWKNWLSDEVVDGKKYVLPGNTTLQKGHLQTFSRGGSDTSGGLAAYAISADLNLNLTDDSALSADPRLVASNRLTRIEHLLYEEGRELGRNGTGLVHPAAMIPLMLGNIPTEIRSTFDLESSPTTLDNDYARAEQREGKVVALSLMEDITLIRIHEPGMAESIGRLATFETALSENKIPIIDSQGYGVDGQKYFVETSLAAKAHDALLESTDGSMEISENLSFITLVGYRLERKMLDNIRRLTTNSGIRGRTWQEEGNDISLGKHSLRISIKPEVAREIFSNIHASFIESPQVHSIL